MGTEHYLQAAIWDHKCYLPPDTNENGPWINPSQAGWTWLVFDLPCLEGWKAELN